MNGVVDPVVAKKTQGPLQFGLLRGQACRMARLMFSTPPSSMLKELGSAAFPGAVRVALGLAEFGQFQVSRAEDFRRGLCRSFLDSVKMEANCFPSRICAGRLWIRCPPPGSA